jgi:hypothetical protein
VVDVDVVLGIFTRLASTPFNSFGHGINVAPPVQESMAKIENTRPIHVWYTGEFLLTLECLHEIAQNGQRDTIYTVHS